MTDAEIRDDILDTIDKFTAFYPVCHVYYFGHHYFGRCEVIIKEGKIYMLVLRYAAFYDFKDRYDYFRRTNPCADRLDVAYETLWFHMGANRRRKHEWDEDIWTERRRFDLIEIEDVCKMMRHCPELDITGNDRAAGFLKWLENSVLPGAKKVLKHSKFLPEDTCVGW